MMNPSVPEPLSDLAPVHSTADLQRAWRRLVGGTGFARRTLWFVCLDETGAMLPLLIPVEDLPDEADDDLVAGVAHILSALLELPDVTSVAALLSRPGLAGMTDDDRAWARVLVQQTPLTRHWPLHLATRDLVEVFAPDDLVASVPA